MRYHSNQNVKGCLIVTSTFVFIVDILILVLAHLQSVGSLIWANAKCHRDSKDVCLR